MKKKIISIFFIVLALAGVGAIMAFSFIKKDNICSGVELKVIGDEENTFVSKSDIEDLLNSLYVIRPGQTKTSEINTQKLEALIKANPYVTDANCYFVQSGKLIVDVEPKQPVIRVFNGENISYYLQEDGRIIPLSPNYVADVPMFTIDKLEANITAQQLKQKMLYLGKIIAKDELWNAATSEIHVSDKGEFTMFTSIANHEINLGDTSQIDSKLARLKYFYQDVLPKRGWDKYSSIDLRYNSQIVATNSNDSNRTSLKINNISAAKPATTILGTKLNRPTAKTTNTSTKVVAKSNSIKAINKKEPIVKKVESKPNTAAKVSSKVAVKSNVANKAIAKEDQNKKSITNSKTQATTASKTTTAPKTKAKNNTNQNHTNTKGNDKK